LVAALHGVFAPAVADHGLIQGAAPPSNSAIIRVETSAYKSRFTTQPRRYGATVISERRTPLMTARRATAFKFCSVMRGLRSG
jgi:hypothetical protein